MDAQRDAERSLENKKRRDELSAQVAQKAAKARTLKAEGLNALEQIAMIESKKRTLCEMRDTLQKSIEEAKQAGDEEFDEKKKSISSEAYRKGDLSLDGTPTKEAVNLRQERIEKEKNAINGRVNSTIAQMKAAEAKQDTLLRDDITNDLKHLSQNRIVISSLQGDLEVSFGQFDGDAKDWNVTVYTYCGGQPLKSFAAQVDYGILPGLDGKPLPSPSKDRAGYLDAVDTYDSLFSRGDPILTFEADYSISYDDDMPSVYTLAFGELRIKDTRSGKLLAARDISGKEIVRRFTPAYDIRPPEVKAALVEKERKEMDKIAAKEAKERERTAAVARANREKRRAQREKAQAKADKADERKRAQREGKQNRRRIMYDADWAYNTQGNGAHTGVGFNIGSAQINIDASMALLPWVFVGGRVGFDYKIPDGWKDDIYKRKRTTDGKVSLMAQGYIGGNFSVHLGSIHPSIFGTVGIGSQNVNAAKDINKMTQTGESTTERTRLFTQTCGIAIPLGGADNYLYSNGQGIIEYVRQDFNGMDVVHSISFGIRWSFPYAALSKIWWN